MSITPPSPVGLRNDEIRQKGLFGPAHKTPLIMTPGVSELGRVAIDQLVVKLMQFDDWGSGNDPYGDRDFGTLTWEGRKVFFKIERDEVDPDERIITLLTPSEY